ncbi:MAG: hypothetical protein Q9201_007200 [Fulgogasparrea decipioides]
MASPFMYDALDPKHIRLFKLDSRPSPGILVGKLVVFRHPCHYDVTFKNYKGIYRNWNDMRFTEKQGDAYGYDALSYAWGSPVEKFPLKLQQTGKIYKKGILSCDGLVKREGIIDIHRNLYDLLRRLQSVQYDRFIWVDAICINQSDDKEKSMQIPLMRDIYQEAKQVMIWLGEASPVEEGALTILPNLVKKLEGCAAEGHILNPGQSGTFESKDLPTPMHPLWRALGAIMTRQWFRRLWTLQEAVLPETTSVILCGGKKITWITLEAFVSSMYACRLANWTTTGDVAISTDYLNGYESVRMTKICRDSMQSGKWGVHLDILLNVTRRRSVTNPADMVFGILALMPHGDQQQITVDTSLPVEHVYRELARYYILNEPDECILNHTSSQTRKSGLPSWCPDFASQESTVPLNSWFYGGQRLGLDQHSTSFRAGFKKSGTWEKPMKENWGWIMAKNGLHRRRPQQGIYDTSHVDFIAFEPNTTHIRARGALADRVAEVIKPNQGTGIGAGAWNTAANAAATLAWEERCLGLALKTLKLPHKIPEIYWRTLIANLTWNPDGSRISWDEHDRADHSNAYKEFMETVANHAGGMVASSQMSIDARAFASEFVRVTRNRCFFSTVDGRIGLGPADAQPGDNVYIICFCPTPYILRHLESTCVLIGDAYVHDFMYGQALDMIDAGTLNTTRVTIS